jgi:NADH-ubiquinone oxidoreductase chain 5
MSQLGMMVIAVGLSSYNIALFHLVNHAFYKALLFLGAGAVIHAVADNQDFRKYGGLKAYLPLTYSVMLIASLSLVAFPFMTGFYSKDFILESAYGQFYFSGIVVYFIATIGAMFTTLYSVKVLYLTFLTNPNGPKGNYHMLSHPAIEPDYSDYPNPLLRQGYLLHLMRDIDPNFLDHTKTILSNWVSIMEKDKSY